MELSQTRKEIQQSTKSAFTLVRMQRESCSRVLFERDSQPQNSGDELCGCLSEKTGDHCRQEVHVRPLERTVYLKELENK